MRLPLRAAAVLILRCEPRTRGQTENPAFLESAKRTLWGRGCDVSRTTMSALFGVPDSFPAETWLLFSAGGETLPEAHLDPEKLT
jgi:hypothetical protein